MKICIVAGARPNFIKVAPILHAARQAKERGTALDVTLVYAGRADDPTLEPSLFADLQIAPPDVYLDVDSVNLNEITGQVMSKFEAYLQSDHTDVVIVEDDLASTMAAAIVTKKQGITLAHLAAGTRSFDISMPKEINRLVIDGLSDLLFTAGISNNSIANREGAELSKVYMVGNILIDNIRNNRARFVRPQVLSQLGIADGSYIVFTLNRKALMAGTDNMRLMLQALLQAAGNTPIIAPLHNRAQQAIEPLLPADHAGLHTISPLGYLEFSYLASHAKGIVTDSGNVAEEATFNQVPCITLNSYTEHIETVKVGTNVLVGEDATLLGQATSDMVAGRWKQSAIPDRWDGRSAERILQTLLDRQH